MVLLVSALALSCFPQETSRPESSNNWREQVSCGVNCVYFFTLFFDLDKTYDEVVLQVPITDSGSQLSDMANALRHFGLHVNVSKLSPSELENATLPVIVHTYVTDSSADVLVESGHFLVLIEKNEDKYVAFDPSKSNSGLITISKGEFIRAWSGFVLSEANSPSRIKTGLVFILLAVNAWFFPWRLIKRWFGKK